MRILITLLFVFSTSVFADVSREEALGLIDDMVKSNMISAEEAEKAKVRVFMNTHLDTSAVRAPASVAIADPSTTDLASEQLLAIESDLSVIAPHYTSDSLGM